MSDVWSVGVAVRE